MGFKLFLKSGDFLFKLGYSHGISFTLPKNIKCLYTKKNSFKLMSTNLEELLITVNVLQNLKTIDRYKGKGLRIEGLDIKLKESTKSEF